ncbi:hypothetical protein FRB99_008523 [Tulasnella sp. 403]|nr:hypothetical protein FRB99_008523 [Tulasnella sp. 403]
MPQFRLSNAPELELVHDVDNSAVIPTLGSESFMTTFQFVQKYMSSISGPNAGFKSACGIEGHLQTIWSAIPRPSFFKHRPVMERSLQQTILVRDGGNIVFDISSMDGPEDLPIIIGVHGIGGSSRSSYIQEILTKMVARGWRAIAINLRGCGPSTLTSPQIHHGGSINDLGAVVAWALYKFPDARIHVVGASLGACITHNYIGEMGEDCPLSSAGLLSPVYDFTKSHRNLEKGHLLSRLVYNKILGVKHIEKFVKPYPEAFNMSHYAATSGSSTPSSRSSTLRGSPLSVTPSNCSTVDSAGVMGQSLSSMPPVPSIEEAAKAVLMGPPSMTRFSTLVAYAAGYDCPVDFMERTSSVNAISNVAIPVLALNAADDPLLRGKELPREEVSQSRHMVMCVTKRGGHLGWFGTGKDGKTEGHRRWFSRVFDQWFAGLNDLNMAPRPHPKIVVGHDGYMYPEGRPDMAFMEVDAITPQLLFRKHIVPFQ